MKYYLFLFAILINQFASATHNKGGYISFQHISGTTYEITVTMYTDGDAIANHRKEIEIKWGDNTSADSIVVDTETIVATNSSLLKRVYVEKHTYPGAGNYFVSVEDPNKVAGINNISNSVNAPTYLETLLRISPLSDDENNSVEVLSPLCVRAEIGRTLRYNLSAFNDDMDVLFYELVPTKGAGGHTARDYVSPNGIKLDIINGELSWEPTEAGLFAVTVKISECRKDVIVSSTLVDLLIEVYPGPNSSSLMFLGTVNLEKDGEGRFISYALPGDSLELDISLVDQNSLPDMELLKGNEDASFKLISTNSTTVNKRFEWIPDSTDLSCTPHLFTFRGINNQNLMQDISLLIYVADTNLMNCDSLCGPNIISIPEYGLNKSKLELVVSPNPFSIQTQVNILSEQQYKGAQLKLYNSNGKLIRIIEPQASNEFVVQRGELKSGIYFFSIEGNTVRYGSGKLILLDN